MVVKDGVPSTRFAVLDTDIGVDVDDDLALMTTLAHVKKPGSLDTNRRQVFDKLMVTTVGFLAPLKAIHLLESLGWGHVAVHTGRSTTTRMLPFNPFCVTLFAFFWSLGVVILHDLIRLRMSHLFSTLVQLVKALRTAFCRRSAADTMVKLARTQRHRVDIICVGPLTNIATAMQRDPDFLSNLRSLTIMGGLCGGVVPGCPPVTVDKSHGGREDNPKVLDSKRDTNVRSDVVAFQMIMASSSHRGGGPLHGVTLVPLDVTMDVFFGEDECKSLVNGPSSAPGYLGLGMVLWSFAQVMIWDSDRGASWTYLHDPLSVLVAARVQDGLVKVVKCDYRQAEPGRPPMSASIISNDEHESGGTIFVAWHVDRSQAKYECLAAIRSVLRHKRTALR